MRTPSLTLALCACIGLSVGCTKKSSERAPAEDTSASAAGQDPATPEAELVSANLIEARGLAELYPGDAIAVAAIAAPERLFALFDRDAIVARLGTLYTEASAEIRALSGQDLLSLEGILAFGVDPSKPIGVFMWSAEEQSGGAFVSLRDRAVFLRSLASVAEKAGESFENHDAGDDGEATILCPTGETEACVLVTGTHAYIVGADQGPTTGLELAKRLAKLTSEQSLAGNADFHEAMTHLQTADDIAGYVNLRPIIKRTLGELGARDQAQASLVEGIVGPMRAVAIGGSFAARSFSGQAFLQTEGSSLLTKLGTNGTRVNPVVRAMGEDALLLGAYNFDPAAILAFVELVAASEGEELDSALAELRTMTGIDLEAQLIPALSGELGLGIRADADTLLANFQESGDDASAQAAAAIDGAAMIGFRDIDKGKALVEQIVGHPMIAGFVSHDEQTSTWTVTSPIDKTISFSIAAPAEGSPYLAIASEPTLLSQLRSGAAAPSFSGEAQNPEYAEFIDRADIVGLYSFRQAMLGAAMWALMAPSIDSMKSEPGSPSSSPELASKRAEIDAVEAELEQLDHETEQRIVERMRELFTPWGVTATSLALTPEGFDMRLGQFIGASSWPELAAQMAAVGIASAAEVEDIEARRAELYAREAELRQQLMELEGPADGFEF